MYNNSKDPISRIGFQQSKVTNVRVKNNGEMILTVDRPCNSEGWNLNDALNKVFNFT